MTRTWILLLTFLLSQTSCFCLWTPPQTISSPQSFDSQVAIDAAGTATAVWTQNIGSDYVIQSSRKHFGGNWSEPVTISSTTGVFSNPQIAVSPDGYVVVVFQRDTGPNIVLQAVTRSLTGNWSRPVNVSSGDLDAGRAKVAIDNHNNAVAVWRSFDDINFIIQAADLPFGKKWSSPVDLSEPGEDAQDPDVAIDTHSIATAIWARESGSNSIIQSSSQEFGKSWSKPVFISSLIEFATVPRIGLDRHGNAVSIWRSLVGGEYFIKASTRLFGEDWSGPETISFITPSTNANNPELAVDGCGDAYAVWTSFDGSVTRIAASNLFFGADWAEPVYLSSPSVESNFPQVAADVCGCTVIAVWNDSVAVNASNFFEGEWSDPVAISPLNESCQESHIAIDPTGYAVSVWNNTSLVVIQSASWIPAPKVCTVRPHSGPKEGENTVLIIGTNFVDVHYVLFGSTKSTCIKVLSRTEIEAVVPPHAHEDKVKVSVKSDAGLSFKKARYKYT